MCQAKNRRRKGGYPRSIRFLNQPWVGQPSFGGRGWRISRLTPGTQPLFFPGPPDPPPTVWDLLSLGVHSQLMRKSRKVSRYPFGLAGRLHPAGGGVGANVVVRVISTEGCEIDRAEGPSVGKKCELYFDWQGAQIGVEARVVWRDAQGRMGLKFLYVDSQSQTRLNELCTTLRSHPLSAPLPEKAEAAPSVPDSAPAPQPARPTAVPSPPPRPARGRERRRVPRYVSELPAYVSNPATGATLKVILVTLSVLGGCLDGSGLPEPGRKCDLITEWEGKPLLIEGEIVWKGKEQVGLKFAPVDEKADKMLRQICGNLRLQPLAPLPPEPQ